MDDRRPEREVKQRGDAHAVDVEARVAGVGAAHDVERGRPDDLRDPGERADHADGVARRSRHLPRFVAADGDRGLERGGVDRGLVALAGEARRQPDHRLGRAVERLDAQVGGLVSRQLRPYVVGTGEHADLKPPVGAGVTRRDAVDGDARAAERPPGPLLEHLGPEPDLQRTGRGGGLGCAAVDGRRAVDEATVRRAVGRNRRVGAGRVVGPRVQRRWRRLRVGAHGARGARGAEGEHGDQSAEPSQHPATGGRRR